MAAAMGPRMNSAPSSPSFHVGRGQSPACSEGAPRWAEEPQQEQVTYTGHPGVQTPCRVLQCLIGAEGSLGRLTHPAVPALNTAEDEEPSEKQACDPTQHCSQELQ